MKYLVESYHEIYQDSFTQGELDLYSNYTQESTTTADTPLEAVEKYISDCLSYTYNKEYLFLDKSTNTIHYDVLVDKDMCSLSDSEFELWKKDKFTAYNNRIQIYLSEIKEVNISEIEE